MSRRCSSGRHAFTDGACTRKGCTATTTGDLFGAPLDATAGALFEAGELEAAQRGAAPPVLEARCIFAEASHPHHCSGRGWVGGDERALYVFTDLRTGGQLVRPIGDTRGIGPECSARLATRAEAEAGWQNPLSAGWRVA